MDVLLLSHDGVEDAVPSLGLLAHKVTVAPATAAAVSAAADAEAVIVDARAELAAARTLCRLLSGAVEAPVVALVSEGGLVAVNAEWGIIELLLPSIGPAELDARLRLLASRSASAEVEKTLLQLGELVIDEETYLARLRGKPLDLTYKEFELLKYLVQHAGRVFTREQLLHEVWGYD
ncbi:winged helix-turn-helix domain-containing protein, partial [Dietzia sp.]|uniref:winged helix-turn-helix domain-containing protein n=1 Tax=Dietzia sp. TaxID=1871616 RepID=UPI002FDB65E2